MDRHFPGIERLAPDLARDPAKAFLVPVLKQKDPCAVRTGVVEVVA
jgi:hypothetical protein